MESTRQDGAVAEAAPRQPRPPSLPKPVQPIPQHHTRWWIQVLIIAGVLLLGYLFVLRPILNSRAAAATDQKGQNGPRQVPVVAGVAKKGDLPLYLNGLGTVTPFNLVTVRSRIEGAIMKINFEEGQMVKKDDLLVEIDPRPYEVQLEMAQGQLGRDQALLANAKVDLTRYQSAGTSISQQTLDTAAATVRQDEAIVKSDDGAIDSAKLNLAYCHITAPISGRVGLRRVDIGNIVEPTDVNGIVVITQLQPIALEFSIFQDQALKAFSKAGGGVGLRVDAFNLGLTQQLATGTISAVENQVDLATGTLRIKATFANAHNELYASQLCNARLLTETLKDIVLVPAAAVQRGPDSDFVYVIKADQTVDVRKIELGEQTGDQTQILTGVEPGEMLVTDGVDKLAPGSKVAVREHASTTQPSSQPTTRSGGGSGGGGHGGRSHGSPA